MENPESVCCWRHIGVSGDATCKKLESVIHCRNCKVFTATGRLLLDREPPPEYQNEWADILKEGREKLDKRGHLMLIFRIGNEWLMIPVKILKLITESRKPHRIPHRGGILEGIVNVDGQLLLLISLGRLLNISDTLSDTGCDKYKCFERMIVMEKNGLTWGFSVNEILEITRVDPETFKELPITVAHAPTRHVKATVFIDGKHVAVIDEDLLFDALNRSLK